MPARFSAHEKIIKKGFISKFQKNNIRSNTES